MSYFNDEQRDHMRYLETVPPANLCWCGWFLRGECATKSYPECEQGQSCAAKLMGPVDDRDDLGEAGA
jgi:hypothetical protein